MTTAHNPTMIDEQTAALKREAVRRLGRRREVDLALASLAGSAGLTESAARAVFPGRDDLLTALILDAYNAMGDSAEQAADAAGDGLLERWVAICCGVRNWALACPDEYALVWGQPIPGYDAPPETMVAGARTVLALLAVVREALAAGRMAEAADELPFSDGMARNVGNLSNGMLEGLPDPVIARMLVIWTQLHGMVGFEVYGHIAGAAADPAAFFVHAARAMGVYVGLPV